MTTQDETHEDHPENNFLENFFTSEQPHLDVNFGAATHPGLVRERNEDHFAVIRRTRTCDVLYSNLPEEDVALVNDHAFGILVADGVGGARFGDFASQLVLETVFRAAGLATNWLMRLNQINQQQVEARIGAYVAKIQEAFARHIKLDPDKRRMGTTLTTAYLMPANAILAHVGDSRAYLYREGLLMQLTRDHTLAQEYIDSGVDVDKIRKCRHILTNSIGGSQQDFRTEVMHIKIRAGDRLLLCTDGLSDLVDARSISGILQEPDPQQATDALIQAALDAGGRDNVTVVVSDISDPDMSYPTAAESPSTL